MNDQTMNEKRKAYGVFLSEGNMETLIYSDAMSYAIYEREEFANAFKKEMDMRWSGTRYKVHKMYIEVKKDE